MDFLPQYLTLKTIILQLFEFYPIDIICYIMKLLMTAPIIDIFCRKEHTFVVKDFFGIKTLHYYGKDNHEDSVSSKFNLIGNKFNAGEYDASIILSCQQKIIYFSQFEYDKVSDIFSNYKKFQYCKYLKSAHKIVCYFPEKISETFHSKNRLHILSETRKTIYGLRLLHDDDYPRFNLCHEENNIKLFRYEFIEEIKKIICDNYSTYILTMKGNLYLWKWHRPIIQSKISTQSYVDFDVAGEMPPICLTANGIVYVLDDINHPTKLNINEPVKKIYCESNHANILTQSGKIYTFYEIGYLELNTMINIDCDNICINRSGHCFLIDKEGKIYGMGTNNYGQLAIERSGQIYTPQLIDF